MAGKAAGVLDPPQSSHTPAPRDRSSIRLVPETFGVVPLPNVIAGRGKEGRHASLPAAFLFRAA